MPQTRIVLIDDDLPMLELGREVLSGEGYAVTGLSDSLQALDIVRDKKPAAVITDLQMPGKDGMQLLRELKEEFPEMPVLMLTGHGTVESAVEAVQYGAADYLAKPFSPDELCLRLHRALNEQQLRLENQTLRLELTKQKSGGDIIGNSRVMQQIFGTIDRAAPTDASVLIMGESGTGKEMVARTIHQKSKRSEHPFVPVDCVSLPDKLIESELFGHMKGAFTGAVDDKEGLLETAEGGTIFLDEITELNVELQGKLLRVLQERQFRRVGGRELHDLDVRVVAATNRDPQEAIAQGRFRQDLYYRLNVIPIELPPLRERGDDVVQLINHFLRAYGEANGKEVRTVQKKALNKLLRYPWPGNVRELQNMMERLLILAPADEITVDDLPDVILNPPLQTAGDSVVNLGPDLYEMAFKDAKNLIVSQFEIDYLTHLLRRHNGNISSAARDAGIDRKTIHRLVAQHNIQV